MRLGRSKDKENRIAVAGRLDGDDSEDEWYGEFGLTGAPKSIATEMLRLVECGMIAWNHAVDMTVEMEEKASPAIHARWKRTIDGSYETSRQKEIRHHRNQVWKTTMRRSMNDVSKRHRPALTRRGGISI